MIANSFVGFVNWMVFTAFIFTHSLYIGPKDLYVVVVGVGLGASPRLVLKFVLSQQYVFRLDARESKLRLKGANRGKT